MRDDGAAYEWCLNLTGWVSLSDDCAGQYNGSQHHQRLTGRRRKQRRGLQRRRRRQLGQRPAAERAAAATTKILAHQQRAGARRPATAREQYDSVVKPVSESISTIWGGVQNHQTRRQQREIAQVFG